jgi:hypothetical protein
MLTKTARFMPSCCKCTQSFSHSHSGFVSSHFFLRRLQVIQPVFDRPFVALCADADGTGTGCLRGRPRGLLPVALFTAVGVCSIGGGIPPTGVGGSDDFMVRPISSSSSNSSTLGIISPFSSISTGENWNLMLKVGLCTEMFDERIEEDDTDESSEAPELIDRRASPEYGYPMVVSTAMRGPSPCSMHHADVRASQGLDGLEKVSASSASSSEGAMSPPKRVASLVDRWWSVKTWNVSYAILAVGAGFLGGNGFVFNQHSEVRSRNAHYLRRQARPALSLTETLLLRVLLRVLLLRAPIWGCAVPRTTNAMPSRGANNGPAESEI